ncbi:MAG: hypothetical protein K9G67_12450 [Bacteroidales bacterium]|nr:hypothetical protein [Bacteroidales bacterium]MCF8350607.1 hypothetical protein [Bacteroidales bacterium]MCF8377160.1 hypothetical protein [Bacteroidales bacterium]
MKSMIKIIATFALLLFVVSLNAQNHWTLNGTDIYKNNSGNVGVGTTTPSTDIEVYDNESDASVYIGSPYTLTANRAIGRIRMQNTATSECYNFALRRNAGDIQCVQNAYVTGTGWVDVSLFNYTTRNLEIKWGVNDVVYTNSGNMIFTNTGGVGIGTSTIPANYKLAVDGKVIAEELEIQLSGSWPDYVFSDNYNLMTLSDLEEFINNNNHLPDIPSASDVENGTLKLGEMNKKLLEKIEELTLYVIELKNENVELNNKVNQLIEKN